MSDNLDPMVLGNIFATALDHTDALIALCDQDAQLAYANPAFHKMFDTAPDQYGTLKITDLIARGNDTPAFSDITAQSPWRAETCFNTAQDPIWCRTTVSALTTPEGTPQFVWVMVDISEQKRLEQQHQHDKRRLNHILDHIPAYVFSKDRDGRYTYVNKLLAMLHAQDASDIIGKTDFELFTDEAARTFTKNDKQVFEKQKTIYALEDGGIDEYGIERSYLSVKVPLDDENGDINELLGMSVDISEQKRLEKALRESEEKLSSILDNMKARVYIKDHNLKYTYANQELCHVLKSDQINLLGKDDFDLFETETAVGFRATDEEVLKTGEKVDRLETSVEPHTGEKRYYWSVKVPLLNAEGVPHSILGISTDITERKRLEKALQRNEKQLTTILDTIKAHVYIKDINYTYTYVNADMCKYLDMEKDDIIGQKDKDIFGVEHSEHFRQADAQVLDSMETTSSIEESTNRVTGETHYFWSIKVPMINDLGNPYAILGISSDVSEQKRLEDKLRTMASTDPLTGINNRRHFMELFERELIRAKRYGHTLSLIMLDVDHFKKINDTFGHAAGDKAIQSITGICLQNMRATDIIGRIGGEEFALLLPETDAVGAWTIAQRIRTQTEIQSFDAGGEKRANFTASLGLSELSQNDQIPDDLLKRADIALYEAKESGRNRVCEN